MVLSMIHKLQCAFSTPTCGHVDARSLFSQYDELTKHHGVFKVETIGKRPIGNTCFRPQHTVIMKGLYMHVVSVNLYWPGCV